MASERASADSGLNSAAAAAASVNPARCARPAGSQSTPPEATVTAVSAVSAETVMSTATRAKAPRRLPTSWRTQKASRPHHSSAAKAQLTTASSTSRPLSRFSHPAPTSSTSATWSARRRRSARCRAMTISPTPAGSASACAPRTSSRGAKAASAWRRGGSSPVSAEARFMTPTAAARQPAAAGSHAGRGRVEGPSMTGGRVAARPAGLLSVWLWLR